MRLNACALVLASFFVFISPALASDKTSAVCLPVGAASLHDLPFQTQAVLENELRVGSHVFPKGCEILIDYGPEITESYSQKRKNASKIITYAVCEAGMTFGGLQFKAVGFDSAFCLSGPATLVKAAEVCGAIRETWASVAFKNGKVVCVNPAGGSKNKLGK